MAHIRIQRSVGGGNLVEVLRTTGETMRERASVRRHVRALSAEGRLSAYILIALPILIRRVFLFLHQGQLHAAAVHHAKLGLAMMTGAVVLVVVGIAWMRNVVKVVV